MYNHVIRNGTPFPMKELQITKGFIPQSILGSYIKNGPGLLTIGDQILSHWFIGNSGLLKLQFHDGKVYGKYKFVETPAFKKDIKQKSFSRSHPLLSEIKSIFSGNKFQNNLNPVSTSVFRQPNSDKFLALCEGGYPYEISQKLLSQNNFKDFGYIKRGFSAHPKVDPDNGDIYNIGLNMGCFDIYRMSKDFKLLAQNSMKLRVTQSIHDCCLAGDYLVVFECPIKIDMWKLLKGNFFFKCVTPDFDFGKTIVFILNKHNLELVQRIQLVGPQTFFMFHFTNGYVQNNKLFVEYAKYSGNSATQLLQFVDYVPHYASNKEQHKKFDFDSELETLEIDLNQFSYKFHTKDINCEFPICQDSQVGKKWRYSYFVSKDKGGNILNYNRLVRYDRFEDKIQAKQYPQSVIAEPALIHAKNQLYILVLISSPQKCFIQILNGDTFELVTEIQLPELIPFGFHGKWIDLDDQKTLESAFQ